MKFSSSVGWYCYLEQKSRAAREDRRAFQEKQEPYLARLAGLWEELYRRTTAFFTNDLSADLISALRRLQNQGQAGSSDITLVTSQEIELVTITHSDQSAECIQAFLYYSLDALTHMNCVPMFLEGLPIKYQCLPSLPEHQPSVEEYRAWAR